jgi:hypothetical protein
LILLITTCRGRNGSGDYLARLQRQIDDSGWTGRRVLVSDGLPPAHASGDGWSVAATAQREGQKKSYWRALALGTEECRRTGSDRMLILEDDVELCTNALPYMERARLPGAFAFVTWYDGHAVRPGAARGIYPAAAMRFICLQAITWTPSVAEELLSSEVAAAWSEPHGGDLLVAKILGGRSYGVHVPNLVQHLGSESVCSPGVNLSGARTASNYAGRKFDAAILTR